MVLLGHFLRSRQQRWRNLRMQVLIRLHSVRPGWVHISRLTLVISLPFVNPSVGGYQAHSTQRFGWPALHLRIWLPCAAVFLVVPSYPPPPPTALNWIARRRAWITRLIYI